MFDDRLPHGEADQQEYADDADPDARFAEPSPLANPAVGQCAGLVEDRRTTGLDPFEHRRVAQDRGADAAPFACLNRDRAESSFGNDLLLAPRWRQIPFRVEQDGEDCLAILFRQVLVR